MSPFFRVNVNVPFFPREDVSVQEIATVLEVPAGTVKSRLFHAKRALPRAIGRG
jgi:DNA-directed RNA polymerase specialized sigma24 family protein